MNREEQGKNNKDEGAMGFRKLIVWKNSQELRKIIYEVTRQFPAIEMRRVSQMRDAARSVKQNIQEGYSKNTLGDYMRSLEISRGSLAELMGDLEDCFEDNLIKKESFESIRSLCIKTKYLFDRLLTALHEKKRTGTWRRRWTKSALLMSLFLSVLPFSSLFIPLP